MELVRSIIRGQGKAIAVAALALGLATAGAGSAWAAAAITDENVDATVMAAKSVENHQALAAYFTAKSAQSLANVERHKTMANAFSGKPASGWQAHCQSLAKSSQAQADDYAALAKEQEAFAKGMQHSSN